MKTYILDKRLASVNQNISDILSTPKQERNFKRLATLQAIKSRLKNWKKSLTIMIALFLIIGSLASCTNNCTTCTGDVAGLPSTETTLEFCGTSSELKEYKEAFHLVWDNSTCN